MTAPAAGACCLACGRRLAGTRLAFETRRGCGFFATARSLNNL